jgi:hypothetical protein
VKPVKPMKLAAVTANRFLRQCTAVAQNRTLTVPACSTWMVSMNRMREG